MRGNEIVGEIHMKITKKHAIIGIAVIILVGVGFFFLGGAQGVDSNAGVKTEKSAKIVKDAADNGEKSADKDDNKSEKAEKNDSADKKSNAASEKKDTGNSNNSNKNNSNSSNSSNNTPSKPTHTHSWTAVYKTVTETEYVGTVNICSTCGVQISGSPASHAEQHNLNGENGGHYSKPIYEEVTKSVYSHDKCSCGATR